MDSQAVARQATPEQRKHQKALRKLRAENKKLREALGVWAKFAWYIDGRVTLPSLWERMLFSKALGLTHAMLPDWAEAISGADPLPHPPVSPENDTR